MILRLRVLMLACAALLLAGGARAAEWQLSESPTVVVATIPAAAPDKGSVQLGCVVGKAALLVRNIPVADAANGAAGPRARLVVRGETSSGGFAIISENSPREDGGNLVFNLDGGALTSVLSRLPFANEIELGIFPAADATAALDVVVLDNVQTVTIDRPALEKIMAACPVPDAAATRSLDDYVDEIGVTEGQWSYSTRFGYPVAFTAFEGRRLFMSCEGNGFTLSLPAVQLQDRWMDAGISVAADRATMDTVSFVEGATRRDKGDRAVFSVTTPQRWIDDARRARKALLVGLVFNPDESIWTEFPVRGSTAAMKELQQACAH